MECPNCHHISESTPFHCKGCGERYDYDTLERFHHAGYLLKWLDSQQNHINGPSVDRLREAALEEWEALHEALFPPPEPVTLAPREAERLAGLLGVLAQIPEWVGLGILGKYFSIRFKNYLQAEAEVIYPQPEEVTGLPELTPAQTTNHALLHLRVWQSRISVFQKDILQDTLPLWEHLGPAYGPEFRAIDVVAEAEAVTSLVEVLAETEKASLPAKLAAEVEAVAPPTEEMIEVEEPTALPVEVIAEIEEPVAPVEVLAEFEEPAPPAKVVSVVQKPAPYPKPMPGPAVMAMEPAKPKEPLIQWDQLWSKVVEAAVSGLLLRWSGYLGAFLFVVSTAIIVISYWDNIPKLGQLAIIFFIPATFYTGGWWVRQRLQIQQMGAVLMGVGQLVFAVDFAAIYQTGSVGIPPNWYWFVTSLICTALYIFTSGRLIREEFFGYISLAGIGSSVLALVWALTQSFAWPLAALIGVNVVVVEVAYRLSRAEAQWHELGRAAHRFPLIVVPVALGLVFFVPGAEAEIASLLSLGLATATATMLAWRFVHPVYTNFAVWGSLLTAGAGLWMFDVPSRWFGFVGVMLSPLYVFMYQWLQKRLDETFARRAFHVQPFQIAGLGLLMLAFGAGLFTTPSDFWFGVATLALVCAVLWGYAPWLKQPLLILISGGLFLVPLSLAILRWPADLPQRSDWLAASWAGLALGYTTGAAVLRAHPRYTRWLTFLAQNLLVFALVIVAGGMLFRDSTYTIPPLVALGIVIGVYLLSATMHDSGKHPALSIWVNWLPDDLRPAAFLYPISLLVPVWISVAWWGSTLVLDWLGAALAGLALVYIGVGQVLSQRHTAYRRPFHLPVYLIGVIAAVVAFENKPALMTTLYLSTAALAVFAALHQNRLENTLAGILFLWPFQLSLELSDLNPHAYSLAYILLAGLGYLPLGLWLRRSVTAVKHHLPTLVTGYCVSVFAIITSIWVRFNPAAADVLWIAVVVPLLAAVLYVYSTHAVNSNFSWAAISVFSLAFWQGLAVFDVPLTWHPTAWVLLGAGYLVLGRMLKPQPVTPEDDAKRSWIHDLHWPLNFGSWPLVALGLALTAIPTLTAFISGMAQFESAADLNPIMIVQSVAVGFVVLAAVLYRSRWPLLLQPWLAFVPVTLFFIAYGERMFGQPLTSSQFGIVWAALGVVHVAIAVGIDQISLAARRSSQMQGLHLGGYLLAAFAVLWTPFDTAPFLWTLGIWVALSTTSAVLVHFKRHLAWDGLVHWVFLETAHRFRSLFHGAFVWLAAWPFPIWLSLLLWHLDVVPSFGYLGYGLSALAFLELAVWLRRVERTYAWALVSAGQTWLLFGLIATADFIGLLLFKTEFTNAERLSLTGIMLLYLIGVVYYVASSWYFQHHRQITQLFAWAAAVLFPLAFWQSLIVLNVQPIDHATAWVLLGVGYLALGHVLKPRAATAEDDAAPFWATVFYWPLNAGAWTLMPLGLALTAFPTLIAFTSGMAQFASVTSLDPFMIAQWIAVGFVVLAAVLYRSRWPLLLQPWLAFVPVTLFFIAYGERMFGQPLTSPQFGIVWAALGLAHVAIATGIDQISLAARRSSQMQGLYLGGYLLVGFAVLWTLFDTVPFLWALGIWIAMSTTTAVLTHFKRHPAWDSLVHWVFFDQQHGYYSLFRGAFVWLAAWPFPIWLSLLLWHLGVISSFGYLGYGLSALAFLGLAVWLRRVEQTYAWALVSAGQTYLLFGLIANANFIGLLLFKTGFTNTEQLGLTGVMLLYLVGVAYYAASSWYFQHDSQITRLFAWVTALLFPLAFWQSLTVLSIQPAYHAAAWVLLGVGYLVLGHVLKPRPATANDPPTPFWATVFYWPLNAGAWTLMPLGLALTVLPTLTAFTSGMVQFASATSLDPFMLAQWTAVGFVVLAAVLYRSRWPLFLQPWLTFGPVTLFFIAYGERMFGQPLASPQYGIVWAALGLIHVAIAIGIDQISLVARQNSRMQGLYLGGYLFAGFAVLWTLFDTVPFLWTLGMWVALSTASAVIVHLKRHPVWDGLVHWAFPGQKQTYYSLFRGAFVWLAAWPFPIWLSLLLWQLNDIPSFGYLGYGLSALAFLGLAAWLRHMDRTYAWALISAGQVYLLFGLVVTLRFIWPRYFGLWYDLDYQQSLLGVVLLQTAGVAYYAGSSWYFQHRRRLARFFSYVGAGFALVPYSLIWIVFPPDSPNFRMAYAWIALAAALLEVGYLLDRQGRSSQPDKARVGFAHGPYLVGYMLVAFALIWSWVDQLTNIYVWVGVLSIALVSHAAMHFGRHTTFSDFLNFFWRRGETLGKRAARTGFLFVAAYGFPIWAARVMTYNGVSLAWHGMNLALIAPVYIAFGLAVRRVRPDYTWPLYTAGYLLTAIGAMVSFENQLLAIWVLTLNVVVYAASAYIFRQSGWLFLSTVLVPVIGLMAVDYNLNALPIDWVSGMFISLAFIYYGIGRLFDYLKTIRTAKATGGLDTISAYALPFYAPGYLLSAIALAVASSGRPLAIVVYLAACVLYTLSAWTFRETIFTYLAVWLAAVPCYLGITYTELPPAWYGIGWLPLIVAAIGTGKVFFHKRPLLGESTVVEGQRARWWQFSILPSLFDHPAMPFYSLAYTLSLGMIVVARTDMAALTVALTLATLVYLGSSWLFKRVEWLYLGLPAGHLALLTYFAIDPSGRPFSYLSLAFLPVTWGISLIGMVLRKSKIEREITPLSLAHHQLRARWAAPFLLFAALDIVIWQSAALFNWETAIIVTTSHALLLGMLALKWINLPLTWGSIGFLTLGIGLRLAWTWLGLPLPVIGSIAAGSGLGLYLTGRLVEAIETRLRSLSGLFHHLGLGLALWGSRLTKLGIIINALGALITLGFVASHTTQAAAGLAFAGTLYLAIAYRGRYHRLGYMAVALLELSFILVLMMQDVSQPQWYAIPAGLYFSGVGVFERRRGRMRFARLIESFGLMVMLVTSFIQSLNLDAGFWYFLLLLIEGLAVITWGAQQRRKLPFLIGIGANAINVAGQIVVVFLGGSSLIRWVIFGGVGLSLLSAGLFAERWIIPQAQELRQRLESWN